MTRAMKPVKLNDSVTLIDTPGILVQGIQTSEGKVGDNEEETHQMRVLRSALQVDDIPNPENVVPSILAKVDRMEILRHYRIADFGDSVQKMLELIAIKKCMFNSVEKEQEAPVATGKKQKSIKSSPSKICART